jgi:hypothetical protein
MLNEVGQNGLDAAVSYFADSLGIDATLKGNRIVIPKADQARATGQLSGAQGGAANQFKAWLESDAALASHIDERTAADIAKLRSAAGIPAEPVKTVATPETVESTPQASTDINTGALGEVGMGGAKPAEFQPVREITTGIKNAMVDKEREARGQEPILAPQRLANPVVWDRAMDRIDKESGWQDRLIAELKEKPRNLSAEEVVALDHRYVDLQNEYAKAQRDGARHYDDGYEIGVAEAKARADFYEGKLNELEHIARRVGTEWGRSGQMRQRLIREDFSLAAMEAKVRAAKGFKPLTEQEHADIAALHEKLAAQEKAAAEAEQAASERISLLEVQKSLAEAKALTAQGPAYEPRVLQAAEKFATFMDKKGEEALGRIRERLGRVSAGIDPTMLSDIGILGAAKLTRGIVNKAKWVDSMVRDLGEWFREHAEEAWESAQVAFGKDLDTFHKGVDKATKERVRTVTTDLPGRIEDTKTAIKERAASAAGSPLHSDVKKLVRLLVEADPKITRDALVDTVHGILKESLPDITRLEAMDAISGRGKFWTPPKDEVSRTVRDLTAQIRLVGHQIDVEAGKPLPRTGYQPDKLSDAARREQQKLNELKRKYGVTVTDPTAQLGSVLQARKTYYTNRMADLKAEIASRQRTVTAKTPSPTDAALDALKAEYEKVKSEHDEIFGRKELTDEQRLATAIAAAERAEVAAEAQLTRAEKGDFGPKPEGKPLPASQRLDEIRARTAALREETKELRSLDEGIRDKARIERQERELAGIDSRIAEAERRINEGDIAAKKAVESEVMPELAAKRAELEELNKVIARLRAAEKGKSPAEREAKQIADLQAKADRLAEQINAGEIAVSKRTPKKVSPEMEAARAEIAELNKIRQQLRTAAKPKGTPEEIALQSLKARLAREKADLTRRIVEGDFSPRKKAPREIPLDTPAAKAKAEVEALKQEFHKRLERHKYEMKSRLEKIWHGIKQSVRASVNLVSSYDVSAPRQAVPALLAMTTRLVTHPVQASKILGRTFGRMFQALGSEIRSRILEQKRKARDNAKSGADEMAGIEYTDIHSESFTRREENAHSILDEWAQLPFKTGNAAKSVATAPVKFLAKGVRASNRAFATFLNEMRAQLFDELLRANFKDRAPTETELKVIGNLVNVTTGRGKIHPKAAKLSEAASIALWSPKLNVSRAQLLLGQPLWGGGKWSGSAKARRIVAKEYARIIAGGFLLSQAARLFDDKDEVPMTSSDKGKIVRGDTRIDPWGGLQQMTVLASRVAQGEKTTLKGKTQDIGAERKYGVSGPWAMVIDFGRSKLRPDVGAVVDILDRRNYIGEPTTPGSVAKSLLVPLPMREITDIMREHGFTEAMIIQALNLFGAGVSNYEEREKQR